VLGARVRGMGGIWTEGVVNGRHFCEIGRLLKAAVLGTYFSTSFNNVGSIASLLIEADAPSHVINLIDPHYCLFY
jgi:hypothetical protein